MKKYFVKLWLIASSGLSALILSTIFGAYVVAYDIKRAEWGFFISYPRLHEGIFMLYILSVTPVAAIRWRRFESQRKARINTEDLFFGFLEMTSTIVDWKTHVIHSNLPTLTTRSLKRLIKPSEQIQTILRASDIFLRDAFELTEDQLDITVKECNPDTGAWHFRQTLRGRVGTDANSFFGDGCLALQALKKGRSYYWASKAEAAANGEYREGIHDKDTGDGSVFCHPISFRFLEKNRSFVISITTYGKRLCDPGDRASIKKTKALLREIVRRLELELTLNAVVK